MYLIKALVVFSSEKNLLESTRFLSYSNKISINNDNVLLPVKDQSYYYKKKITS